MILFSGRPRSGWRNLLHVRLRLLVHWTVSHTFLKYLLITSCVVLFIFSSWSKRGFSFKTRANPFVRLYWLSWYICYKFGGNRPDGFLSRFVPRHIDRHFVKILSWGTQKTKNTFRLRKNLKFDFCRSLYFLNIIA